MAVVIAGQLDMGALHRPRRRKTPSYRPTYAPGSTCRSPQRAAPKGYSGGSCWAD